MKRKAFYEPVERPSPALRELRAESVASDIGHVVLFGKWRNSAGWIFTVEGLAEKNEVSKASANRELGPLERLEVRLKVGQQSEQKTGYSMGRGNTWVVIRYET
jgi:hypothetical protein